MRHPSFFNNIEVNSKIKYIFIKFWHEELRLKTEKDNRSFSTEPDESCRKKS